eukprot:12927697-Prorocentrum_lima.AAC.1
MDVMKWPYETTARSEETHSEESGSHQAPEDEAGFYDVKNGFNLPPGIVPGPGFHNPKNNF